MYNSIFFFFSIACFFYAGLGSYALLNNNEGLYAQISWEMLQTGNWIIPHLNGVPYIEKPPLLYWLIGLSFKIFGKTEFAARFIPATFGFLTCLSLYFFGRSLNRAEWGKLSAFILASCCGFIVFSRMVFFDIVLTFFLTNSAVCFYKFYQTHKNKYLYCMSGFMALALLTKGFVCIALMGLLILSFLILERNLFFLTRMFHPLAVSIFLIISVPWHVLASLQDPRFPWFYFVNEHWMRFLDKRIPKDYYTGPFYYYIPRILGYLIPWTFLSPMFLKKKNAPTLENSLKRFLWCWFIAFLIFFSISRAKANYYMIAGMPPLALYLGAYLDKSLYKKYLLIAGFFCSASLTLGGMIYVAKKEISFSAKNSVQFISKEEPIYLYKRFEEFSSLPFYANQIIPIINSESRDLWYGQQATKNQNIFLTSEEKLGGQAVIYMLKRDEEDFLQRYPNKRKIIIYDAPSYRVVKLTRGYK